MWQPIDYFHMTLATLSSALKVTNKMYLRASGHLLSLQELLAMFKADVDAAFRRIPILVSDRPLAKIVWSTGADIMVSTHICMPFGSVGSVHGWDRTGALLLSLARKLLRIPMCRYVDDFFAGDRAESAEHATHAFRNLADAQ